jgi:hypothetical protein
VLFVGRHCRFQPVGLRLAQHGIVGYREERVTAEPTGWNLPGG